jgi:hypothetical protein
MLWLANECSLELASWEPRVRKTGTEGGVGLLRDWATMAADAFECECECSGPFEVLLPYHLNFLAATGGSSVSGFTTRTNLAISSSWPLDEPGASDEIEGELTTW